MADSQYARLLAMVKPPVRNSSKNTSLVHQPEMASSTGMSPLPQSKALPKVSASKTSNYTPSRKSQSAAASKKTHPVSESKVTSALDPLKVTFTDHQSAVSNFMDSSEKKKVVNSSKKEKNFYHHPIPRFRTLQSTPDLRESYYKPRSEMAITFTDSQSIVSKSVHNSENENIVYSSKQGANFYNHDIARFRKLQSMPDPTSPLPFREFQSTPDLPDPKESDHISRSEMPMVMPLLSFVKKEKPRKSKGSKSVSAEKASKGAQSGPESKVFGPPSKETHINGSNKSGFKVQNSAQRDSNTVPSWETSNSVPLSDEPIKWTKWRPVVQSKVNHNKSEKKIAPNIPKNLIEPPPVGLIKRPGENSKKRFLKFAKAVYLDILKFIENLNFEDHEFELDSKHQAFRELFLMKRYLFKTDFEIEDPDAANFYMIFLSWGAGLLNYDLSELNILEFIIKVCSSAISVKSKFPYLERIVRRNAIEAIAEFCVLCNSKLPEFWMKIE